MPGKIPEIPGIKLLENEAMDVLVELNRNLGFPLNAFPGAQPVSFVTRHLESLREEEWVLNYYVCEKSDGVRCLLYTKPVEQGAHTYLITRKREMYYQPDFFLPRNPTYGNNTVFHLNLLLDGELVIDTNNNGHDQLCFYTFDALVVDAVLLTARTLDKRLAYFYEYVYNPYRKALANPRPDFDAIRLAVFLYGNLTLSLKRKSMERSYAIEMMRREILPHLKHGNDGLIFTSRTAPYKLGTNDKIMKWKPASENSIDLKVEVVEDTKLGGEFTLNGLVYKSNHEYQYFGKIVIADDKPLVRNECRSLDGQIVEVRKDPSGNWEFMRVRDDKHQPNHISVAMSILRSIEDGVTITQLLEAANDVKKKWKERDALTHPNQPVSANVGSPNNRLSSQERKRSYDNSDEPSGKRQMVNGKK